MKPISEDPELILDAIIQLHEALDEFARFTDTLSGPSGAEIAKVAARLRDEVASFLAERLPETDKH